MLPSVKYYWRKALKPKTNSQPSKFWALQYNSVIFSSQYSLKSHSILSYKAPLPSWNTVLCCYFVPSDNSFLLSYVSSCFFLNFFTDSYLSPQLLNKCWYSSVFYPKYCLLFPFSWPTFPLIALRNICIFLVPSLAYSYL